jgi:hypothetical protein
MNSKIKQFAEQVNAQAKEVYEGDWPYNCAAWTGEELIEFAKLIAQDCADIAEAGLAPAVVNVIKEEYEIEDIETQIQN